MPNAGYVFLLFTDDDLIEQVDEHSVDGFSLAKLRKVCTASIPIHPP
jgi:hypothetical protein